MSQERRRFNPQSMAKELAYVKLKVNEVLTNDDMPVMGRDIEKIHIALGSLQENEKRNNRNVNILTWCIPALLIVDILLRFF
jgi:hypothetical protein|tara:strand:+ start:229 stop:474 length:246 start_codon:yes stop_codon:yes gene_type:complete